jgi:penicillin-binding protein 1A
LYLNQIYLGAGVYGVEAACQTYFGKSVTDISLDEAALIAGLPKAPSVYAPTKHPDRARQRRDVVLKQLLQINKITPEEYKNAISRPVTVVSTPPKEDESAYFVAYVKQLLNASYNQKDIHSQGLSVHTTLNLDFQKKAHQAMVEHIRQVEKRVGASKKAASNLQCALVAIEIRTGRILCMIGGKDFNASSFNRAVQAQRQPGSAFKPFVYATALNQGFEQSDLILDAPLSYQLGPNQIWRVNNYSGTYSGEITLRKALALSKNTTAVRLLERVGAERVIALARKAGIKSQLSPTLSLALGSYEVNLMELTAAYIPFAGQGIRTQPYAIEKISADHARIIFQHRIEQEAIMSRQTAAIMTDMLHAVILEGTGKKALVIKKEIAGKTGTTDHFKDALFIGFSPEIALGVWVGNDDSTPLGKKETGARAALPIWIDCMDYFLSKRPAAYFDIPDQTKMVYMNPQTGNISETSQPGTVKALVHTKGNQ